MTEEDLNKMAVLLARDASITAPKRTCSQEEAEIIKRLLLRRYAEAEIKAVEDIRRTFGMMPNG